MIMGHHFVFYMISGLIFETRVISMSSKFHIVIGILIIKFIRVYPWIRIKFTKGFEGHLLDLEFSKLNLSMILGSAYVNAPLFFWRRLIHSTSGWSSERNSSKFRIFSNLISSIHSCTYPCGQ